RASNSVEDIRWSAVGPDGLIANPGQTGINLTWNVLSGAGSYNILRSTNNGSGYTILIRGVTETNFTDSTAVAGTTYFYVVSAVDANGGATTGQNSNQAAITAPPPALTILYTGTNSILSWPASAAGFNLYGATN